MNEKAVAVLIICFLFSPVIYEIIKSIIEYKRERENPFNELKRFLIISLAFFFISITIFGILSHTNYLNYEKPITYSQIDSISFKNFKGIEFLKKTLYGNKQFAYIVTSIDSDINENYVEIKSYFHPSRSYVYNTHSNSKELLKHELYHFKITELYTRIAKKRISLLENPSYEEVKNIINQVKKEENEFQTMYDYDTFHSYVFKEQKKYEMNIDSLLNLLSFYEKPKITINE